MSARILRSIKFIPRHKKKVLVFGILPSVIYRTYLNSQIRVSSEDMGQFENSKYKEQQLAAVDSNQESLQSSTSLLWKFKIFFRSLTLLLLFLPSILASPVYLFSPDKWYSIFAYCVESAGPVFIKLAQYVSQRGDLFNEQLSDKFNHLREHCKVHSIEESQQLFKDSFGKELTQVFDTFIEEPIASGSIGQVYKASIGSEEYVVKVRHPGVKEMIDKDLTIIFGATQMVAKIPGLANMEFPATVDEFKKVLYEQTNLIHESKNLIKFTDTFRKFDNQVIFPRVKDNLVSESILVESFIDAKPISYYMENTHLMNPLIAKVGMNVLYRMIFYENFVHSDCHAGNILVQVRDALPISKSYYDRFEDYIAFDFVPRLMNLIYSKGRSWNLNIAREIESQYTVKLAFIDAGMVTSLSERDQTNFFKFVWHVVTRDAEACTRHIKALSINELDHKVLESLDKSLISLFASINELAIPDINVGTTIQQLLGISASHGIKFEGNFALLLTQLIVLEGIARGLDPKINIVGSTMPFLLNRGISRLI